MANFEQHRIRLRGPWSLESLDSISHVLQTVKVKLSPAVFPESMDATVAKGYRWSRTFNSPTGLSATTRLYLEISQPACELSVELNSVHCGNIVASSQVESVEITQALKSFNTLQLTLAEIPDDSVHFQDVILMIED